MQFVTLRSTAVCDKHCPFPKQTMTKDNNAIYTKRYQENSFFLSSFSQSQDLDQAGVNLWVQVILLPWSPSRLQVCIAMSNFFFCFLRALLSCNLHTIKFICFKYTVIFLHIYRAVPPSPHQFDNISSSPMNSVPVSNHSPSFPSPRQPLICLSLQICLLGKFHINGTIYYIALWVLFPLLRTILEVQR